MKILVIDSDEQFCARVAEVIADCGYVVLAAHTGRAGLRAFYQHHPDLVLLSPTVSDMDGWTVLWRINEIADLPVIILTDTDRLAWRLQALQTGADDYVTKAVEADELIFRVRNALHRHAMRREQHVYDDGTLRVDPWAREVTIKGQPIHLTRAEMSLLACLVRRPGHLVTYQELLDELPWLTEADSDEALRSLLHRLRRKLQPAVSARIVSHRAIGLRLDVRWPAATPEAQNGV